MIKGWVRTTLLDFPGEIATAVFVGGCCFRCPMCHNAELVLNPAAFPDISWEEIFDYLKAHQGKITGIVVSGGEPCLRQELPEFLALLRPSGVKIKLDTCGYFPKTLSDLIQQGLVDQIAMDIKAPPAKYAQLTGVPDIDLDRISQSIEILKGCGLPVEFRTTVVSGWLDKEDVIEISEWIKGAQLYVLQQFNPHVCLCQELMSLTPYPKEILADMQSAASKNIAHVLLRGI